MAMLRFINRLAQNGGAHTGESPSRFALLTGAGITVLMTVFVFSA